MHGFSCRMHYNDESFDWVQKCISYYREDRGLRCYLKRSSIDMVRNALIGTAVAWST
jgi:hypothetical protein